jgi:hypothetical protein
MVLGKKKYKHAFIGKLFGKSVLKGMLKDERPMKKNLPTFLALKVTGNVEVGTERNKWVGLIAQYELFDGDGFMHPFFGWVTKEQSGYLAYKHADHHLRQFNA